MESCIPAGILQLVNNTGYLNMLARTAVRTSAQICKKSILNKQAFFSVDKQPPKIIAKYTEFPLTLYRLLNSKTPAFKAREKTELPGSFDIVAVDGIVYPLKSDDFTMPNGASLRPNTTEEFYLISNRSRKSFICEIPKGTKVPADCVLVHEFGDHFSLQPNKMMSIQNFNKTVTEFLSPCKVYIRDDWLIEHPLGSQITL